MDILKNVVGFGEVGRDGGDAESTSFIQRMGNACAGVCIGLLLFLVAFAVLGWNESRAIKTYKALREGESTAVEIACDTFPSEQIGKLVYVSCDLSGLENLTAVGFEPNVKEVIPTLFFESTVELYQWEEQKTKKTKKNKLGGGSTTVTTYEYRKIWSPSLIDSTSFKHADTHMNPVGHFPSIPTAARQVSLSPLLGIYPLPEFVVNKFKLVERVALLDDQEFTPPPVGSAGIALTLQNTKVLYDSLVTNPTGAPVVGDVRAYFSRSTATAASLIAELTEDKSFKLWRSSNEYSVDLFSEGKVGKDRLFSDAHKSNKQMTWFLRFLGFAMMWGGLQMFFGPISLLPDIIPCIGPLIGDLVGCLLCIATFFFAAFFSLITIAISWIVVRPMIGIPILCGGVAAIIAFIVFRCLKAKKKTTNKVSMQPADHTGYEEKPGNPMPYQQQQPGNPMPYQQQQPGNPMPYQQQQPGNPMPYQQQQPGNPMPYQQVQAMENYGSPPNQEPGVPFTYGAPAGSSAPPY